MKKCIFIVMILVAGQCSLNANWQPYVNLAMDKNVSRQDVVRFYESFWDAQKKKYLQVVTQEAERAFDTIRNKYVQPATMHLTASQIIQPIVMYFVFPSLEKIQNTVNGWIFSEVEPKFKRELLQWLSKQ